MARGPCRSRADALGHVRPVHLEALGAHVTAGAVACALVEVEEGVEGIGAVGGLRQWGDDLVEGRW